MATLKAVAATVVMCCRLSNSLTGEWLNVNSFVHVDVPESPLIGIATTVDDECKVLFAQIVYN